MKRLILTLLLLTVAQFKTVDFDDDRSFEKSSLYLAVKQSNLVRIQKNNELTKQEKDTLLNRAIISGNIPCLEKLFNENILNNSDVTEEALNEACYRAQINKTAGKKIQKILSEKAEKAALDNAIAQATERMEELKRIQSKKNKSALKQLKGTKRKRSDDFDDSDDDKETRKKTRTPLSVGKYNQQKCAICYDPLCFSEHEYDLLVKKKKCEHVFHKNCLEKWDEEKPVGGKVCPLCNVTKTGAINAYMTPATIDWIFPVENFTNWNPDDDYQSER